VRDEVVDALAQSDSPFSSQIRALYLDRIDVGARSHSISADGLELLSLLGHDIFETLIHPEEMNILILRMGMGMDV
jgi:hypothetical protein